MNLVRILLLVATVVTAVGCGDDRPALYPVSGTVLFRSGDPVRNASIELVPTSAGPSPRGRVDRDGHFTLGTYQSDDGAPAGEYQVVVVQPLPPNASASMRKLGEEHAAHASDGVRVVALRHASPETSGVSCLVEPIDNHDVTIVVESR